MLARGMICINHESSFIHIASASLSHEAMLELEPWETSRSQITYLVAPLCSPVWQNRNRTSFNVCENAYLPDILTRSLEVWWFNCDFNGRPRDEACSWCIKCINGASFYESCTSPTLGLSKSRLNNSGLSLSTFSSEVPPSNSTLHSLFFLADFLNICKNFQSLNSNPRELSYRLKQKCPQHQPSSAQRALRFAHSNSSPHRKHNHNYSALQEADSRTLGARDGKALLRRLRRHRAGQRGCGIVLLDWRLCISGESMGSLRREAVCISGMDTNCVKGSCHEGISNFLDFLFPHLRSGPCLSQQPQMLYRSIEPWAPSYLVPRSSRGYYAERN